MTSCFAIFWISEEVIEFELTEPWPAGKDTSCSCQLKPFGSWTPHAPRLFPPSLTNLIHLVLSFSPQTAFVTALLRAKLSAVAIEMNQITFPRAELHSVLFLQEFSCTPVKTARAKVRWGRKPCHVQRFCLGKSACHLSGFAPGNPWQWNKTNWHGWNEPVKQTVP